jgi:cell division protein ZapA (FtsZ GTPase activity inhibitor)
VENDIVHITMLGTSFSIKADENPAYMEELVSYFRKKVTEIEGSVSTNDPLRTSILAGMVIADELFKSRTRNRHTAGGGGASEEADRLTKGMIERLDRCLGEF